MTALLGISGSTRKESWNRALLHAAAELVPPAALLEIQDLHDIPNYDEDHDDHLGGTGTPETVLALRRRIEQADGLVLSSPEYNWSFTGVLKNALDWCSRPAFRSILAGKPALLLGASSGPAGTGRAQLHLRQVLLSTKTPVLIESLQVANAAQHFNEDGQLVTPGIREQLRKLLSELAEIASLSPRSHEPSRRPAAASAAASRR
ncbi:MAG TPA: NAD(P)H-dependent oxidoreductase [Solirubrobacteraceae bacterium]|nr:NAD(P)H-dependent oxidoreductase [Solirubrobacteraceae bacterium]